MNNLKNIIIPITGKARKILNDIEKKYGLTETREELINSIKAKKPFKMNLIVKFTRELMLEKISNHEFLDALHKGLNTPKETTKSIALDIVNDLIPLLEKIPEDQLEEYNRKKSEVERKVKNEDTENQQDLETEYNKEDFQEELLNKIRGNVKVEEPKPKEKPPVPYDKKPEIANVEKNAQEIKNTRIPITTQNIDKKPSASAQDSGQTKEEKPPEAKVDPYKEPIE